MKTLQWIKSQELHTGGLAAWPQGNAFPEVTGYLIPTLMDYGEDILAERLGNWLISIQNKNGSFDGLDGKQRVFDTAMVIIGLSRLGYDCSDALKWIEKKGPKGEIYDHLTASIAGWELPYPAWSSDHRSHYWAYALEGLLAVKKTAFVKKELKKLTRGLMPYYLDGRMDDVCATAQIACLKLETGIDATKQIKAVRMMVNDDGSLPEGTENSIKVLWACKYYLDMELLCKKHL